MPRLTVAVTATGRRTGTPREVALFAFEDGERLVIVGSRGGSSRDPYWAENLRAEPRAAVQHREDRWAVRAYEVPDGAERKRLWSLVSEQFPLYLSYQRRTKRTIPLFVLEPAREI